MRSRLVRSSEHCNHTSRAGLLPADADPPADLQKDENPITCWPSPGKCRRTDQHSECEKPITCWPYPGICRLPYRVPTFRKSKSPSRAALLPAFADPPTDLQSSKRRKAAHVLPFSRHMPSPDPPSELQKVEKVTLPQSAPPADAAPHTNGSPSAPVSAVPARQMPHQESEAVKNELALMRRQAGKAEPLLATFQSSGAQSPPTASP